MSIPPPPEVPGAIRDVQGQGLRTLRDRCTGLGVFTWRTDNAGLILEEPSQDGPVGLLLGSSVFTRLISGAAAGLSRGEAGDGGGVVELFEGAWAVGLAEQRRRDRTGWTIGLALSERGLASGFFAQACAGAALDVHAMRRMMARCARFDAASARALRDALLYMAQDLARVEESDHTVAGFTRQLSDSFETIDLLYALGRSMNGLDHPADFVTGLCERVRVTLGFGFVGALVPGDGGLVGPGLVGAVATALRAGLEVELSRLVASGGLAGGRAMILTELCGAPIAESGQVLVQPLMRAGRVVGAVCAGEKTGDDPQVSSYDIQLLEAAAGYMGAFLDNVSLYAEQKSLFAGTLEALTAAIDAKDRYTCGHSQRVAHLSRLLALEAGLGDEEAERVHIAGLVHDVGKIGVPEGVLTKQGKLTDEEFGLIKLHPEIGHRILKDLPALKDVLPGVLHHHERHDGRGYPRGLKGYDIPRMAKIIALADTFDAMSSTRSYRAAMARPAVLAEIARCAGAQFDPELARLFVTLDFAEYDRMVAQASAGAVRDEPARRAA